MPPHPADSAAFQPQVPPRTASFFDGVRAPLFSAGAVLLASAALHLRDPHEQGSWGICPTKLLSGLDCPGCGGLRAVNDLTNLRLVDAASSNALFVVSIPVLVVLWVLWLRRRRHDPHAGMWPKVATSIRPFVFLGLLALVMAFTVTRNLPGSWLAA